MAASARTQKDAAIRLTLATALIVTTISAFSEAAGARGSAASKAATATPSDHVQTHAGGGGTHFAITLLPVGAHGEWVLRRPDSTSAS